MCLSYLDWQCEANPLDDLELIRKFRYTDQIDIVDPPAFSYHDSSAAPPSVACTLPDGLQLRCSRRLYYHAEHNAAKACVKISERQAAIVYQG